MFKNEISAVAQSYNETTKKFTVTLNSLDDGIYAIIARDNVGNVSAIDLSTFDIASTALPAATFIIDKDLDASDIGYDLINASSIPGPDYKYFKLGSKDAAALEIEVAPDVLGGSLPADVVKVTLQIWGGSQDLLVDGSTPEFQGVISKNLSAVSDHWSVASGSGLSISSKSSLNNPIIELNLKNALPGTSGTIGLKFTAEDIAGNTVSINTPTDQIELDLAADLETSGVPNQGLVTSIVDDAIYSGISVAEAKGLQMSISGLDDDTDRRATFFLSKDQFVQSLKLSSNNNPFTGSLETLTMDASHTTIGGIEVPQYNSGTVYLDLQSAFIQSLKLSTDSTVSAATSTKPIDWKFIGISSGKAQYIAAQDYNDYILEGDTVNLSNYKIYLSDFVVNSHSEGEYITKLEEVTQDISVILKSAGSPNEPIFIINQVYDLAGNTEFRDGILNASDPATTLTQKLVVDVKPATVQEGLQIGGLGDTGVANNDLVTNLLTPSITFSVDEEIISARLVRISDLKTYPMPSELVQYDLRISETLADDGFTYDATLGPNVTLAHGIWGLEVTDVAGNKNLADASPLLSSGVYETNTNLVSATNGLLIIDTDAPPDATINVVGVETEGGFLNNDESISSVEIQIMPGHDDMSPEVSSSKQVAKIIEVLLNEDKINSQGGAYFFDATNAALSEGLHTISVKTMDLAGNFTTNLYTFIKDVTPPPAPLQTFTLENAADGILNREEIGYGTGGKNLKIDIALKDPTLTRLVSVKIDGTLADKVGEEYFVNVIDRSLSDGAHKVTVEVADLAGNITAEELDFNIDTVLPDSPNILVNNAQVKDGKLLLDYWGTLQNVATDQGVIFRFDEISNGDKVISSTVKVNDSSVFVVEEQNSIYFVDRTNLKDSGVDGAVSNTISAQVQEISGNIREFTKTFFSDLDETANQYFEIAPTLYTTGAGTENVNTYIRLDVFVSDQALADTVDTTLIGTSFDLKLDLPSEIFGSKASDVVIATNSKIEGFGHFYESLNSIRWSGYSETNLTNFDEPLLSITSRLPNIDAVKDKTGNVTLSISKIDENVVTTSMDLFDLNYSINMSELVITDSSNIM